MKFHLLLLTVLVCTHLFAQINTDSLQRVIQQNSESGDALEAHLQLGIAHYAKGQFDIAEEHFAMIRKTAVPGSELYTRALNNLGNIEADKGNNTEALSYYQLALESASRANDELTRAHILKNIGALYISWKQFEKALAYYEEALQLAIVRNDRELEADCYNNKGTAYEQMLDYQRALDVYSRALDIYEAQGNMGGVAMSLSNRALVYKAIGQTGKAAAAYKYAIHLSDSLGDQWMSAAILGNLGNLYGEQGRLDEALLYCNMAIEKSRPIEAIEIELDAYESIGNAYALAGNYQEAFKYQKLFTEKNKEFLNAENSRQLNELAVKYETTEKEEELLRLENENRAFLRFSTIIILLLLIVALTVIAIIITRKNRMREKELSQALYKGETDERRRIAQDMHDSIGQQLTVINMRISSVQKDDEGNIERIESMVGTAMREVRSITHRLMPEVLRFGLGPALRELLDNVKANEHFSTRLKLHEAALSGLSDPDVQLHVYRIIQEVVSNMIRHSGADLIEVNLELHKGHYKLQVTDNGKGIRKDNMDNATGIGWKNIHARAVMLGAKLEISPAGTNGTLVQLTWKK